MGVSAKVLAAPSLLETIQGAFSLDDNVEQVYARELNGQIQVTNVLKDTSLKARERVYAVEAEIIDLFPNHVFHFTTVGWNAGDPEVDPSALIFKRP